MGSVLMYEVAAWDDGKLLKKDGAGGDCTTL